MSYQNAIRGASPRRRKTSRELLERWRAAGYPRHYREDTDGKRIWDLPARRESLNERKHPLIAALRILRGKLEYRRSLKLLNQ